MKKFFRKIRNGIRELVSFIIFCFTGHDPLLEKHVEENLLDHSGQGRDKYGEITK